MVDTLDHCWNGNLQGKIDVLGGKFCRIAILFAIMPQALSWERTACVPTQWNSPILSSDVPSHVIKMSLTATALSH
jgi:hypothetical protein